MGYDAELHAFKSEVDLRVYAANEGYELDRKESWRGSAVMRHTSGDKIIIKLGPDGHYVYFSVHRDGDAGTIIDFVKNRKRMSLGAIRKELRPWLGMPPFPVPTFPALQKSSRDRMRVEAEFAKTEDAPRHPYLENERSLPVSLLQQDRFKGRIRIDARGNAIFPHFDGEGLCGNEIKNKGFTGFSSGGTKGLWMSNTLETDKRIVFAESAIDSLSHAALFPDKNSRYASLGGKLSPTQPELIRAAIARMPAGSEVVSAMDADADGARLTKVVRHATELTGRGDLRFVVHEPFGAKDFNDMLRNSRSAARPLSAETGPAP